MSTQNSTLVRDNSTLANFKSWGSTISAFFTTAGWTPSADTGQVNWSTIAVVPTVGNYVYEIWQPGDALTTFYLKVEYGTGSGSTNTQPIMRFSVGSSSNGTGTLTGFTSTAQRQALATVAVTSTSTVYNCYFSGDSGRMAFLLWRDDPTNGAPIFFAIQRSLNSSGAATSSYVTLVSVGEDNITGKEPCFQQSVVLGSGAGNAILPAAVGANFVCLKNCQVTSDLFSGDIPVSPVFPDVGYFDNPMDIVAVGSSSDFTEGSTYTLSAGNMPYGVSHVYLATKNPPMNCVGFADQTKCALLMRYD